MVLGAFALVVAFASSTQDIVIDAWRIETAESGEELGLLSSAYQFGYRVAHDRDRCPDPDRGRQSGLAHLLCGSMEV